MVECLGSTSRQEAGWPGLTKERSLEQKPQEEGSPPGAPGTRAQLAQGPGELVAHPGPVWPEQREERRQGRSCGLRALTPGGWGLWERSKGPGSVLTGPLWWLSWGVQVGAQTRAQAARPVWMGDTTIDSTLMLPG